MPQTSENPRKMKKMSRVIWSYLGNKLLNPEVQFITSRLINTPPCDQGWVPSQGTVSVLKRGHYRFKTGLVLFQTVSGSVLKLEKQYNVLFSNSVMKR